MKTKSATVRVYGEGSIFRHSNDSRPFIHSPACGNCGR